MHNPSNNNCPRNADPRNESCSCTNDYTPLRLFTASPAGIETHVAQEVYTAALEALRKAITPLLDEGLDRRDVGYLLMKAAADAAGKCLYEWPSEERNKRKKILARTSS